MFKTAAIISAITLVCIFPWLLLAAPVGWYVWVRERDMRNAEIAANAAKGQELSFKWSQEAHLKAEYGKLIDRFVATYGWHSVECNPFELSGDAFIKRAELDRLAQRRAELKKG